LDKNTITLLFAVVCVPLFIYIIYLRIKVFNSDDGERYMKRRMQGPFVPLSEDDLARDEARKARSKGNVE
jgi:hypothetical protein